MRPRLTLAPPTLSLLTLLASTAGAQCELGKLMASDAADGDWFGCSVSISGDRLLVGACLDSTSAGQFAGSACVFDRQGAAWVETARLTASDASAGDVFGTSVSLAGDRALVGADGDDDAGPSSGSAYVFELQGAAWVETAKLTASDGAASDLFGFSVFLSGDRAVVGAPEDDLSAGSVYVFELQGAVWVETARLTASDAAAGDELGTSVSLAGDRILVGAPLDDDAGSSSGSAYVFEKQGPAWLETAKLTASDADFLDTFGRSVSLSGERALVGAHLDNDACPAIPNCDSGSAYLFEKQGAVWVEVAKLIASDTSGGDEFGSSVFLEGDRALVGSPFDDDRGDASGSVYSFEQEGAGWVETKLTASDGVPNDHFGNSVALYEDRALAAAVFSGPGITEFGAAYVFGLGPCLTGPTPGTAGAFNVLTVTDATPGGLVGLGFGLALGSTPVGPVCPGLTVELASPNVVGLAPADGSGDVGFFQFVPAGAVGTTVLLQAVDVPGCRVTNLVEHTFP